MPLLYPGPPNQVVGVERWAELGGLEDSCPSNTLARATKIEAQKGGPSRVAWRTHVLPMPWPALPRLRCKKVGSAR
jgi:hypothetical protein